MRDIRGRFWRGLLPGAAALLWAVGCGHPGASPASGGSPESDSAVDEPAHADAARASGASADRGPLPPEPDAGAAPADAASGPADVAAPAADLGASTTSPAAILLFTHATGFVHESRGAAAMALKKALAPLGVTATISEDPAWFTPEKLATLGAVVLIDTTGQPFGNPGTAAIEALVAFVRGGRGLVGIHAASNGYETTPAYVGLIGGDFKEHPGSVRAGRCEPMGNHPSVARLPASFSLTDEFYVFDQYRNDNLVDLRCDGLGTPVKLPIAWHRDEGKGRVFYTGLGHNTEEWSDPRIVDDHVVPGILWTLFR